MRPPRIAAEYLLAHRMAQILTIASMRPPRIAAEYSVPAKLYKISRFCGSARALRAQTLHNTRAGRSPPGDQGEFSIL